MKDRISAIRKNFDGAIKSADAPEALEEIRVKFLGRKRGEVTDVITALKTLPAEERARVGSLANELKKHIEAQIEARRAAISAEIPKKRIVTDIGLPGRTWFRGGGHPLTIVREELENIFIAMGYSAETGPEVEDDFHNFTALNIPPEHPARDIQDTFFLSGVPLLLRTHTSPVQIRMMQKRKPPLKIIAPGKVYRRDYDIRHTPMFVQIEGLAVGENIAFSHLKGTLEYFASKFFYEGTRLRFRPSYFPFTEPSAEVDVECFVCRGAGCNLCGGSGWVEILGAGMVDPNVFDAVGIDPERWTGFAFGLGVDRMTMLKYGVDDTRKFYENDARFLRQFQGF